ncbi:hypothetical protein BC826DRAFT_85944 [Russula brevipes]|nr:hypothetical protein BC826DRAFT_85944 [Russula brevipes]
MSLMTLSPSAPTSFYDILPNDYLHMSYMGGIGGGFNGNSGRFGIPAIGEKQLRAPPTFDYSFLFPNQAPMPRAPSTGSSTSLEYTLATPSDLSTGNSLSPIRGDQISTSTSFGRIKQSGPIRRIRGPNRKRPGMGYTDMMARLPSNVQEALKLDYPGCCGRVSKRDNSSMAKHRFSKQHFGMVEEKLQGSLPSFTCPAYMIMNGRCKSAKAGRYDSAMRHCGNCAGFKELDKRLGASAFPVEVTQEEFDSMQDYRKMKHSEAEATFPLPVQSAVCKVLDMMNRAMGFESTTSGDSFNAGAIDAGDIPTAQLRSPFLDNGEAEDYGNYHDLLSF